MIAPLRSAFSLQRLTRHPFPFWAWREGERDLVRLQHVQPREETNGDDVSRDIVAGST